MSSAIADNIAYRWFCFLTIDDRVFDHSTISYFIERIGREGFGDIFQGLNEELLRLGLLSPEMYADSSLAKANANSHQLSRSRLTVEEFREQAIEENGLFVLSESGVDEDGVEREEGRYCQDSKGLLPLSPVDTDARWRAQPVQQTAGIKLPGQRHCGPGRLHHIPGSHPRFRGRMEGGATAPRASSHSARFPGGRHRLQRRPTPRPVEPKGASLPTFPSIPGRNPTWWPGEASNTKEIMWSVPRGKC